MKTPQKGGQIFWSKLFGKPSLKRWMKGCVDDTGIRKSRIHGETFTTYNLPFVAENCCYHVFVCSVLVRFIARLSVLGRRIPPLCFFQFLIFPV